MFDHEKLHVYQEAIQFVAWAERLCDQIERRGAVTSQMDRAATSIVLNVAEANGKPPGRDRCRFLDIARGSALECAACLDVLSAQGRISEAEASVGEGTAATGRVNVGWPDPRTLGPGVRGSGSLGDMESLP